MMHSTSCSTRHQRSAVYKQLNNRTFCHQTARRQTPCKEYVLEDNTPTSSTVSQVAHRMQKMCRCLLLAVAFVALADGHSLTGLKAHRSRRAVVELTTEQKNILVDKHNELRRLVGASDMEKMVSITQLIVSRIILWCYR